MNIFMAEHSICLVKIAIRHKRGVASRNVCKGWVDSWILKMNLWQYRELGQTLNQMAFQCQSCWHMLPKANTLSGTNRTCWQSYLSRACKDALNGAYTSTHFIIIPCPDDSEHRGLSCHNKPQNKIYDMQMIAVHD